MINIARKAVDLTGKKLDKWTVIKRDYERQKELNTKWVYWMCVCECGETKSVRSDVITNESHIPCKCFETEKLSLKSSKVQLNNDKQLTRFKNIWRGMMERCYNKSSIAYFRYGGNGVRVHNRWHKFDKFKIDMFESYLDFEKINGENTATLDRVNPNRDYMASNCRWITQLEQSHNRSNNIRIIIDNKEFRTISEVAEEYWLDYHTVWHRYCSGKSGYDLIRTDNIENYNPNERYDSNRRLIKRNK